VGDRETGDLGRVEGNRRSTRFAELAHRLASQGSFATGRSARACRCAPMLKAFAGCRCDVSPGLPLRSFKEEPMEHKVYTAIVLAVRSGRLDLLFLRS
jgi:hypothetical protein